MKMQCSIALTEPCTETGSDIILAVHHWDTDGICSAALLKRIIDPDVFSNISAPIGDFSFDERIMDAIENDENIFVVDLNLPHIMEKMKKNVTFIDHHHQPAIENGLIDQINPLLKGIDARLYPSATTVISDEFSTWNMLSVLGAVGDVGDKAFEHAKVMKVMEGSNMAPESISRLVTLIDSNYITMDQEGVEGAVDIILANELKDLLEYGKWNDNVESIERAIDEALDSIIEVDGFAYMKIESTFNIISKLARKATWEMGYPGAIVLNSGFNGKAQTYFRINEATSDELDIPGLIDDLKETGINAGGKKVVMGSIYGTDKIDHVMKKVKEAARLKGELEW